MTMIMTKLFLNYTVVNNTDLCIPESILKAEISQFFPETNPFCSKIILSKFPQTICCYKLNQIISLILSFDSFLHLQPGPNHKLQEIY